MNIFILIILLAFLGLSAHGFLISEIEGEWKNELGSVMKLNLNNDGTLSGSYYSMTGNVSGTYSLNGYYNIDASLLGWTVMWNNRIQNSYSVTTWVGQYFSGKTTIISTWILRSEVSDIFDEWKSTTIGMNAFVKLN